MDAQLPQAGGAGLAGAAGATRLGPEAALGNPSSLGLSEETWLSLSGGNGGLDADATGAVGLAWPIQDDLTLGLGWDGLFQALGPGFGEHTASLSAGLAATDSLFLGLRGNVHQAATQAGLQSAGRGYSLDAGARYEVFNGHSYSLVLGWWGSQLASEWPDRFWRRAVPVTQRLGAAWTWRRKGTLSLQYDDPESTVAAQTGRQVLRAGIETLAWRQVQGRVGVAWSPADSAPLYSVGVGAPFRLGRVQVHADYALLVVDNGNDLRHRAQLQFGVTTHRRSEIVAVPLQVVYEPGTRKVKSARVNVNVPDRAQDVQEWELEIRDKDGRVVRVLRGTGIPPAFVTWDGKDALGEAVAEGDQVSYRLNLKTSSGLRASKETFALDAGVRSDGLTLLGAGDNNDALVIPVLDDNGKVSQLRLKPPQMPGETQRWEILIQGAGGETLHSLEGAGPFPAEILWDGKDKDGKRLLDQNGLRIRFNAYDKEGHLNSVDQALGAGLQPVEEAEAELPRLGLKVPSFREGGPVLAMLLSDSSLQPLPETEAIESTPQPSPEVTALPTPLPSPVPSPLPTGTPTRVPTRTASPTGVPTTEPSLVPTVAPTPVPTAVPTAAPTAVPTVVPTVAPTAVPTAMPTAVPTRSIAMEPTPGAAPEPAAVAAGLGHPGYLRSLDLLPPAIMTREQAEGRGPRQAQPRRPGSRPSSLPATVSGLLDVFKPGTAEVDEARYGDKLQAFYWRLSAFKHKRLLLTGLVKTGEGGGEELSRARVREISRRLVEEGGFEGEFILKVDGRPGPEKGVRVETLRR